MGENGNKGLEDKYKRLDAMMGMLDDAFIEEALCEERQSRRRIPKWGCIVAAACVIAVIGGVSLLRTGNVEKRPRQDHDVQHTLPAIRYENEMEDQGERKRIRCEFRAGDGGGIPNSGWLIIKSLKDVTSKNPTRNRVEEITQLPVFKNEEGLGSDHQGKDLAERKRYFSNPCIEETRNYNYDGTCSNTWHICFQSDETKNLTDQLLEYTFYRISYAVYGEEEGEWYHLLAPPSGMGKMYPLCTVDQAEKKLRGGEFFSHSPYDRDVAETAQILSVELEYLTEEYQTYIQPFYKFIITDKSWKMSEVMQCENGEDYISVSEVYVPAVQDKYLEIKKDADLRTN